MGEVLISGIGMWLFGVENFLMLRINPLERDDPLDLRPTGCGFVFDENRRSQRNIFGKRAGIAYPACTLFASLSELLPNVVVFWSPATASHLNQ